MYFVYRTLTLSCQGFGQLAIESSGWQRFAGPSSLPQK